jgi:hypothetical protein
LRHVTRVAAASSENFLFLILFKQYFNTNPNFFYKSDPGATVPRCRNKPSCCGIHV